MLYTPINKEFSGRWKSLMSSSRMGHESQRLTPAFEFTCCHNSCHVHELSPSYSQLGQYLLTWYMGHSSGAGYDLELPIEAGSLFFNCNPAFELSVLSLQLQLLSVFQSLSLKMFCAQRKPGVQFDSSLGPAELWKDNPWMHKGGISIRWSDFKSEVSEFILGTVPTDKCGFAMVAVLELCLEIIPIYLLLGQPSRASLPLQLGCVEKWPLCAHCPFNLYTQHRYAKLTVTALKKKYCIFYLFLGFCRWKYESHRHRCCISI